MQQQRGKLCEIMPMRILEFYQIALHTSRQLILCVNLTDLTDVQTAGKHYFWVRLWGCLQKRLVFEGLLLQCKWASFNSLRACIKQKVKEGRIHPLPASLLSWNIGLLNSDWDLYLWFPGLWSWTRIIPWVSNLQTTGCEISQLP